MPSTSSISLFFCFLNVFFFLIYLFMYISIHSFIHYISSIFFYLRSFLGLGVIDADHLFLSFLFFFFFFSNAFYIFLSFFLNVFYLSFFSIYESDTMIISSRFLSFKENTIWCWLAVGLIVERMRPPFF